MFEQRACSTGSSHLLPPKNVRDYLDGAEGGAWHGRGGLGEIRRDLAVQSHGGAQPAGTNGASSGKRAGKSPAPFTNRLRVKGGLNNNLKVTQAGSRQLLAAAYERRGRHVAIEGGGGADQV